MAVNSSTSRLRSEHRIASWFTNGSKARPRTAPTTRWPYPPCPGWTFLFGPGFIVPFGNGLILGYLMYRSGLVPRRMAMLGLIAGPVLLLGSIGVLFDWWGAGTTIPAILVIPQFFWELSLGIYCAIWGFRRDSPVLSGARRSAPQTE